MQRTLLILILFLFCLVASDGTNETSFYCETDHDCNDYGTCKNGICDCLFVFEGQNCSTHWVKLYPKWAPYFWTYTAIAAALHTLVVVWACVAIGKLCYATDFSRRTRKSMVTHGLLIVAIGSLLRVIYMLVDPHNARQLINQYGTAILYDLPILFWFVAGLLVFLYWIELQGRSRLNDLPNVKRFRPLLMAFIAITPLVLFPLGLWNQLATSQVSSALYNGLIVIMILTVVTLCFYSGRKVLASIKRVMQTNNAPQYIIFLRTVTYFMVSLMGTMISIVVVLVILIALNSRDPWVHTSLHLVLKILEFWIAMTIVLFLDKRRPKSSASDTDVGTKDKSISSEDVSLPAQEMIGLPIIAGDTSIVETSEDSDSDCTGPDKTISGITISLKISDPSDE
eukprot:TRINITY_DN19615_c0_g1_i1.p1 TRINITY_DN19615_c0_g1~~TRINITY_DN19615_c0_g1_i1.p1  ORF type:complete len:397 (-),score=24.15 TRINITY_DN19615_c0_g1_i1:12-1202(-)